MVADASELGARIREVRLGRGLDQITLARACGLDRTALSRVESGERKVTALELTRIARALTVSLIDLVNLPAPDVRAARRPAVEQADGFEQHAFAADLDLDRALRDLEQLRDIGGLRPVDLDFGGCGLDSEDQARVLARRVRRHLDVGNAPLGDIADAAADLGLWCRTTEAEVDGRSLTPEPGFGVAVIGAHLEPGRRRTTVAHEIGHHLSGDTYESSGHYTTSSETEKRIEAFAAELLLPEKVLLENPEPRRDDLIGVAADYRVSWRLVVTTARRVGVDLGRAESGVTPIDSDFLRVRGCRPQEDMVPPGLPPAWVKACVRAWEEGRITRRRAIEMTLGVLQEDDG
ncbi:MAG: XRE family transcriptional regulator [Actinomyces sp.]|nr:XRE family transcriptional regulator [Actinomyces sp.]